MIFNLVALLFVVIFVTIGSKKGFVRELIAFLGLCAALVVATGKLDFIAVEVAGAIDVSPFAVAVIAYVIVLGLTYTVFKIVARLLQKLISLQSLGQQDKYGGAIIGALRGFLIVGALVFVSILLPLPRSYYTHLEQSVIAKTAAKSIQYLYDSSQPMHKTWPTFLAKLEGTLTSPGKPVTTEDQRKNKRPRTAEERLKEQVALRAALDKVNFFYGAGQEF
jgi:membrane protein required for colicin V production